MARPETPLLACDIVIEMRDRRDRPIVLIERKNPPYGWALPGGFVDVGETVARAARREAREETALEVRLSVLLGVYSDPRRDPRGHTVSLVFVAEAEGEPQARDDAARVGVYEVSALPRELAFDHGRILEDYLVYRRSGRLPAVD